MDTDEYIAKKQLEAEDRCVLPEAFWDSRSELRAICDGARQRMISPETGLGCVLARISAIGHVKAADTYRPRLPGVIVRESPVSLYVALVGDSGAGKTGGMELARDLVPERPEWALLRGRPSTGEAVADCFWAYQEETDPTTKKAKQVQYRKYQTWLMNWDEGSLLKSLGDRGGNTLIADLHSAWSSTEIGTTTSTDLRNGRQRDLAAFSYSVSLVIGVQLAVASYLIGQAETGFPQRFLWFSTHDRKAVRGDRRPKEPLHWSPPVIDPWSDPRVTKDGCYLMPVPPSAEDEIIERRLQVLRGEAIVHQLDGQRYLNQLRVAANLAIYSRRSAIGDDDWELAAMVMTASDATRELAVQHQRAANMEAQEQRMKESVATRVKSAEAEDQMWRKKCEARVLKILGQVDSADYRTLYRRISTQQSGYLRESLDHLVGAGQIVEEEGQWRRL